MNELGTWVRRAACAALVALVVLGPGRAGGAVLAAAPTGGLKGRVVEAGGKHQGIAGVRVVAEDPLAGPVDSTTTGADGRFAFARLPAGRALLRARAPGYAGREALGYPVHAGGTVEGIELPLARAVTLVGRVVDLAHRPIAGAEVRVPGVKATTGADGRFRLAGVSPERLVVDARGPAQRDKESPPLSLRPGETRSLPDFVLLPGRSVSGRVINSEGRPVAGARVSSADREAKTSTSGEFHLGGLGPGGSVYCYKAGAGGASLELPPDSADVVGLELRMEREVSAGEEPLLVTLARDVWGPGETPLATAWAPGGAGVSVRVSSTRGTVYRSELKVAAGKRRGLYEIRLPSLPGGEYTLHVSTKEAGERSLDFLVSPLVLLAESFPGRRRVRAVGLSDGTPVAGLPITAEDAGSRPLGVTGRDGVLEIPESAGAEVRSGDPGRPAHLTLGERSARPRETRVAVLTDRPALRPGGKLGLKVIARREQAGALAPVADSTVKIVLNAPDGARVERTGRLDAEGVYVDSLDLPAQAQFGSAGLNVSCAGDAASRDMPLTNRPTPALQVGITASRTLAMPGDTVRFAVHVTRQDGLPASGVRLSLNLYESGSSYDWGDDRAWGSFCWTGIARREDLWADASGEAELVQVIPPLLAGDLDLRLEARAEEGGSEPVENSADVEALAAARHVAVVSAEPAALGSPFSALLELRGLPRRPIPGETVHVDLYRLEMRKRTRYATWIEGSDLLTGSDGRLKWTSSAVAAKGSEYRLRATAVDSLGRATQSEFGWWTAGPREGARHEVVFELAAQRDTLDGAAPEARFTIRSGRAGVAHVAAAGHDPLQWLPDVKLVEGANEFVVPASVFGAAGVRVLAYASWDGEVFQGTAACVVRRAASELAVQVTAAKSVAQPRDTVALEVVTRDAAGHGVPAEVHLTAFDRGLLAFGPDRNPDLSETFWQPRPLALVVRSSVRWSERAGGKDTDALVRRDFRDVALWLPRLRTGADGRASVRLRVPDNTTTWRITAHAVGEGTAVGRGQAEVVVRRPAVLTMSSPEALVDGDSVVLRCTLREAADEPERDFDDWKVQVEGGALMGQIPAVKVAPGRPGQLPLPIRVAPGAEKLKVTVIARSGAVGDGLERVFPVERPWRTAFGGADAPGVTWDSLATLRWNAPGLAAAAAVLGSASLTLEGAPQAGPERVAAVAAFHNLDRLGLFDLVHEAPSRPTPVEDEQNGEPGPELERYQTVIAAARATSLARERDAMLAGLTRPRAVLLADGKLDLRRAADILAAACAGRDTLSPASMAEVTAFARRTFEAAAAPRVVPEARDAAVCALREVRARLGAAALPAGAGRLLDAAAPGGALPAPNDFQTVVSGPQLWCEADLGQLSGAPADSAREDLWLAILAGRGRAWPAVWAGVAASHLGAADVPVADARRRGLKGRQASDWLQGPEVVGPAGGADPAGSARRSFRRGHADLTVLPDTSGGALFVDFQCEVPDTDAWGEPGSHWVEARPPFHVGETLLMRIGVTRPIELEDMQIVVPYCGAFDLRPAAGAEGSEAKPLWWDDGRYPGRIESGVWRPGAWGAIAWAATARVTHAGSFTLLPAVLHSPIFPGLYRAGAPMTVEVLP